MAKNTAGATHTAKSRMKKREDIAAVLLRKETALANLRELEEGEKRGDLVPVLPMEKLYSSIAQSVRDALMGLGQKKSGEWAAITDARMLCAAVDAEMHEICTRVLPNAVRSATSAA